MRIFSATPTVSLLNRPEMPTIANLGEDRAISALDADLAALYRPTKKREISNGICFHILVPLWMESTKRQAVGRLERMAPVRIRLKKNG